MRIGLAAVPNAPTFAARLQAVDRLLADAGAHRVAIVCFPEAYLPGLRGEDFFVPPPGAGDRLLRAAIRPGHVRSPGGIDVDQRPRTGAVTSVEQLDQDDRVRCLAWAIRRHRLPGGAFQHARTRAPDRGRRPRRRPRPPP